MTKNYFFQIRFNFEQLSLPNAKFNIFGFAVSYNCLAKFLNFNYLVAKVLIFVLVLITFSIIVPIELFSIFFSWQLLVISFSL